jgi:excisionase family DNA binding protein
MSQQLIERSRPRDPLLLLDEVAEQTRAPRRTVCYWIETGRLKAYRVGRRVLVRQSHVDAFIESGAK